MNGRTGNSRTPADALQVPVVKVTANIDVKFYIVLFLLFTVYICGYLSGQYDCKCDVNIKCQCVHLLDVNLVVVFMLNVI